MINAQEWLDRNYPNKQITEKILFEGFRKVDKQKIEGELVISDYPNLKEIHLTCGKITSLKIINCPKITILNCTDNELEGSLDCSQLSQLTKLFVPQNYSLISISLPTNSRKLDHIDLNYNDFPAQDLSIFSRFTNLEELWLTRTRFCGSLEPLKNLKKLRILDICDTDISSGLEYLPDSLDSGWGSQFRCGIWDQPEADCGIIMAQLEPYGSYSNWKKANQELIEKVHLNELSLEQQQIEITRRLAQQYRESQINLQNKENELTNLKKELEDKQEISRKVINQLKEENKQLEEQVEIKELEIITLKQRIEEFELVKKITEMHIEQPPK